MEKLYNIHWKSGRVEGQGYAPLTKAQANAAIRAAQAQDTRDGIEREYWIEPAAKVEAEEE